MQLVIDQLVRRTADVLPQVGMGLLIFFVFWLASLLISKLIRRLCQKADHNTCVVLQLAGRMSSIAVLTFGGVTALGTMGINVSALVAGLGLTGFALGFALKDVLSNLIAGILILVYRPFRINDRITVSGLEGSVVGIDLRYTTLQSEGRRFLIPNSILFTNSIGVIGNRRAVPEGEPPSEAVLHPTTSRHER